MSKRVDTASKLIRASASAICKAFATPDALQTWLPPQGMTGSMVAFSFREGGTYRMRIAYNESPHPFRSALCAVLRATPQDANVGPHTTDWRRRDRG